MKLSYWVIPAVFVIGSLAAYYSYQVRENVPEKTEEISIKAADVLVGETFKAADLAADEDSDKSNSPTDDPKFTTSASEGPDVERALTTAVKKVIRSLILGQKGEADRKELEAEIAKVIVDCKASDATTAESAATSTLDTLLEEANRARPSATPMDLDSLSPYQVSALTSLSENVAGSLLRALRSGGTGAHDGIYISATLDIDVPKGYAKLPWKVIGGFEYREGMALPKEVQAFQGKKVGIAGYMMPTGEFEKIRNFILVESQWSCCFGEPPDINQVLDVTIQKGSRSTELVSIPVLVLGTLDVGEVLEDGWVVTLYRIKAESVEMIE